jgi:hypothetical protein
MLNLGPMELLVLLFMLAIVVGVIALGVNLGIRMSRRKR